MGGLSICGSGWWVYLLNVEAAYLSSSHAFISGMFAVDGAHGMWRGGPGGGVCSGHLQVGLPSEIAMTQWEQLC